MLYRSWRTLACGLAVLACSAQAQVAPATPAGRATTTSSTFNPAISLILSGLYTHLSQDPANYRISGFIPGGEIGPGVRGFSLAESELAVSANIDPYFYGNAAVALAPDNSVSVEEAFIQTLGLARGVTLKAGRFFSGIGYLNEQHAHVWDFVDAPLAYQAFLGTQFGDDGVQVRWLAPLPWFVEVGAEAGRGSNFPGAERDKNGAGAAALFVHAGGDVGASHSWRAGVSHLRASPRDRTYSDTDLAGNDVVNAFSGTSRLWLVDFVWKWAPGGNAQRNLKLQAEYFRRRESGALTYDVDDATGATNTDAYASTQSGGYVQAVYQLTPQWRTGVRFDRLDSGRVSLASNGAVLAQPDYKPTRVSWMAELNTSEFGRIRLQLARDRARQGVSDNQVFVQYQMSLGAHGAHSF